MRLLLLGTFGGTSWHDGLAAEAQELGWRVDRLPVADCPVDDVVRQAKGADLLMWVRHHGHDPAGSAGAMLRRVEDAGTATVGLHMDLYWGVPGREQGIGREPWWSCQSIWTADGGPRPWASRGVRHHWCPPAVAAGQLGRVDPAGTARVVFTGRVMRVHGEHRRLMLQWARARWGDEFAHYGEPPETAVHGDEFAGIVSAADVVLGDSAPASHYWSDRVVRTLARGGILAHPRVAGMDTQGFTGRQMLLFERGNLEQLGEVIDATAGRDRADMRQAAVELVRNRHLWRHRLETIAAGVGCG